jgi:hypothetical protein
MGYNFWMRVGVTLWPTPTYPYPRAIELHCYLFRLSGRKDSPNPTLTYPYPLNPAIATSTHNRATHRSWQLVSSLTSVTMSLVSRRVLISVTTRQLVSRDTRNTALDKL